MYQAIYYDFKTWECHLRDSEMGWSTFKYSPTYYQIDPDGDFETLDGLRASYCKKIDKTKPLEYYEIDIPMETRVLIDLYKDIDEAPKWQNILFFDIEIEIGGALTPEYIKASPMPITSIALYDKTTKQKICFITDKSGRIEFFEKEGLQIIPCASENELIKLYLDKWEELDPTIITGWNSGYFDIPYLYYRILRVLGEEHANRLSPLKKIKINDYDPEQPIGLAGLNHLDYMLLFKKFITKQEPSYKLGEIGEKYVGLGKIEYDGNLDKLFREDINKYIDYNVNDVDILIKLDEKMQFIELAVNICHLCHVPYEQIYYSTVMNEGAILTYLKRKNIVSPNKPTTINPELKNITVRNAKALFLAKQISKEEYEEMKDLAEYAGGYLKEPIPGLYEWVSDLDFTSLYPSIIRNMNMGLETLVGRIQNRDKYDNQWGLEDLKKFPEDQEIIIEKVTKKRQIKQSTISAGQLVQIIEENNFLMAANGTLFRQDVTSIVVEILNDWFNKRKEYNTLKKKYGKEGNKELESYYDRLQHSYKIKLNDLYGCYALNSWRYSDGNKFISKAITLSGQRLIQESINFVNKEIAKELKEI